MPTQSQIHTPKTLFGPHTQTHKHMASVCPADLALLFAGSPLSAAKGLAVHRLPSVCLYKLQQGCACVPGCPRLKADFVSQCVHINPPKLLTRVLKKKKPGCSRSGQSYIWYGFYIILLHLHRVDQWISPLSQKHCENSINISVDTGGLI